jgi:hypothetical protein
MRKTAALRIPVEQRLFALKRRIRWVEKLLCSPTGARRTREWFLGAYTLPDEVENRTEKSGEEEHHVA